MKEKKEEDVDEKIWNMPVGWAFKAFPRALGTAVGYSNKYFKKSFEDRRPMFNLCGFTQCEIFIKNFNKHRDDFRAVQEAGGYISTKYPQFNQNKKSTQRKIREG